MTSILLETDLGVLVVDLPSRNRLVETFVRLCACEYYRNTLLYSLERDFIAAFGDPTGTGTGGKSYNQLIGVNCDASEPVMSESGEWNGIVLFCNATKESSRFFMTLSDASTQRYAHLRATHFVLGSVAEDFDQVVRQLNERIFVDNGENGARHRPLLDVRLRRSIILFSDIDFASQPPSPFIRDFELDSCPEEWDLIPERPSVLTQTEQHQQQLGEEVDRDALLAETRAIKLEILGDLSNADARPDENALFVCKLNPCTTSANLEVIFSRFGRVVECAVKRDAKTGESLQYAFVHFAERESCEEAYKKMQNVMIDGRRIKVDFSQSQGRRRPQTHATTTTTMESACKQDDAASYSSSSSSSEEEEEDRERKRDQTKKKKKKHEHKHKKKKKKRKHGKD